ncbi:protein IQ-DOMAIN 2-like [Mangifera indica]|uniref:protein IQ-DOMAIN 2-like n=1 Tax=Mangifera indica TaxID=29780 RepID=UPI001CFB6A9A|nr:protein IQ-DOMAIN 2-like [Mangifera indica]
MGRKGKWFSNVKKALSPDSKERKEKKSKKKWFGKEQDFVSESVPLETVKAPLPPPPPALQPEEVEDEQRNYAATVVVAATVSEEAVVVADAVPEVVRFIRNTRFDGKSEEEAAAIRIQTAFRGYLARRALRALRGLVRLKLLIEGPVVKRQATNTLRCMQTLSRVQSQILSRRIRMSEENQALQKQLLQKHAKEIATQMGDDWDDSLQSKEKIEASLLSKFEAAMRRERAMAYSFSHQKTWKNSSKSVNPMFMDPRNPTWGWSWLERWMAGQPWESHGMTEKEISNDSSSVKSASRNIVGEISRSYARHQLNSDKQSPTTNQKVTKTPSRQSPSTSTKPPSSTGATPTKPPSSTSATPIKPPSSGARKLKPMIPRASVSGQDDDTRSMVSVQSNRRHTIGGSSVQDDESQPGSPAAPRYMVPTESARAKSRLQSPLGADKGGTPEEVSSASAKKRLSYPPSPAKPRRLSAPPKLDSSINTEISVSNGAGN